MKPIAYYLLTWMCTHTISHTHVTSTDMWMYRRCFHLSAHSYTLTCTYYHNYTHIHTYTHTQTYTHSLSLSHTHTHTHTHTVRKCPLKMRSMRGIWQCRREPQRSVIIVIITKLVSSHFSINLFFCFLFFYFDIKILLWIIYWFSFEWVSLCLLFSSLLFSTSLFFPSLPFSLLDTLPHHTDTTNNVLLFRITPYCTAMHPTLLYVQVNAARVAHIKKWQAEYTKIQQVN